MATETENWDDDFEFGGQKTSRELDRDGAAPEGIKEDRSRATHVSHGDGEGENWDADFEDEPMGSQEPARFPQTIPDTIPNSVQSSPKRPREEDYDSEDDDEAEFGAHGEEEDKTVTARSRRPLAQERPPVPESTLHIHYAWYNNSQMLPLQSRARCSASRYLIYPPHTAPMRPNHTLDLPLLPCSLSLRPAYSQAQIARRTCSAGRSAETRALTVRTRTLGRVIG